MMKRPTLLLFAAVLGLSLPLLTSGCDRTISKSEKSTTSSDGTVKTQEKTVTQSSDGTVTTKEETKKTTP